MRATMTGARVSVLVSNHNYGRFLEAGIASVRAQTLPAHEIIVVDDGSADDSRALLAGLGPDVRIILQEQLGQAGAMDTAVAASSGDILCFLDADDLFVPDKLERVARTFEQHPDVEWVRHRLAMVDNDLRALGPVVPAGMRAGRVPAHPGLFAERVVTAATSGIAIRRSLAERVFPLDRTDGNGNVFHLRRDADALLLGRAAAAGAVGYTMPDVLTLYRQHDGQVYTGTRDVRRALERQIEIADAIAAELGVARGVGPSQSHKHALILATLDGASRWCARRTRAWVSGTRAVRMSLGDQPRAAARQLAALTFAYVAPTAWLRRFHRNQAWTS